MPRPWITLAFAGFAALALLAGCDRPPRSGTGVQPSAPVSTPQSSSADKPSGGASSPQPASSMDKKENETEKSVPAQGQVDARQPEQRRDYYTTTR